MVSVRDTFNIDLGYRMEEGVNGEVVTDSLGQPKLKKDKTDATLHSS